MRQAILFVSLISLGCARTTYRSYGGTVSTSCRDSPPHSLELRIVQVAGDLRAGGEVEISGQISNCTDSAVTLALEPGPTAQTLCSRPVAGVASVGGSITGCPHGPCSADVLTLAPGGRSVVTTSQQVPFRCRSSVKVELEYVSEKNDRYVYPSNLWVGTLRAEPVILVTK